MRDFSDLPFEDLLCASGYECACDKHHSTAVRRVVIGQNALCGLPALLDDMGIRKPYIMCDPNTYAAAGERAVSLIRESGRVYELTKLKETWPEPDEVSLGHFAMGFDPSCDAVLAIGSGVIIDLSKVLAFIAGRRLMAVGTAPSMDGFASNSSSMLRGGVKTTMYNLCPEGILLDTGIMAAAPMRMLYAGFGDMLAKYVSVCEWRLSHLITGEYYCENIAGLVRRSVEKIMSEADHLSARSPAVIKNIAEGLVMSGIAMSYAGTSRPASGLEHYFSHVWDMRAIMAGKQPDLHGIQVGAGTLLTLKLYDWLREIVPDRQRALKHMRSFDSARWESEMRRIFGPAAGQIIETAHQQRRNDPEEHASRLNIIINNWDKILDIVNTELPRSDEITALAGRLKMPRSPRDIGLNPDDVCDALIGAREIRDKYLLCGLLWDLGLLDEFARRMRQCV
jgi:glycerol-1-phosphate dehydrogenase [NAD(P)+]